MVFIDDGSKDKTYEKIQHAHLTNEHVRGLRFSRNFGKESAIFAGLSEVKGSCAVVIDCDLQHPPELIPKMYQLWQQGYQVVEGIKKDRGNEGIFYKMFAKIFYGLISNSSHIDMSASSDYKLLDRKVINEINKLPEHAIFFRATTYWMGFKSTSIEYEVRDRQFGKTKWSKIQLLKYGANNIVSFTSFPLYIVSVMGALLILASIVLGIQTLVNYFTGQAVAGFTTVILLLLIIGGAIMISLGIIGYYLSKIFNEVKGRPKYIISQSTEDVDK